MSDEIVSKLMRNHKKLVILSEDADPLYEADEDEDEEVETAEGADEEYAALTDEESTDSDTEDLDIEDDSTAPEQGNPDDEEPEDIDIPEPRSGGSPSSHSTSSGDSPESPIPEEPTEEDTADDVEYEEVEGYKNPLDNQYAIKFTMGDDVKMTFTGDSKDTKTGMIDGYDTEGFYRVKWSDGTSTNGLTDIALAELVKSPVAKNESVCVCGSSHIIRENNELICDDCGRKIDESSMDALTLADKSRPKGKRIIRSEAHPMSTAVKPSIAESIKKALSSKSTTLNEEDDPDIESDVFANLKKLENEFWTRKDDMKEDIEELGYYVDELNDEYVVVSSPEDDENAYQIFIEGTSRSFFLDFKKSRMI